MADSASPEKPNTDPNPEIQTPLEALLFIFIELGRRGKDFVRTSPKVTVRD